MEDQNPADVYPLEFEAAVRDALEQLGIHDKPVIERPRSGQADLCLVCFPLAGKLKRSPADVAGEIHDLIGDRDRWQLTINGGYLNCTFDLTSYLKDLGAYIWSRGENFGEGRIEDGNVIVEHTSANPNGPFHVGRARNPIIGDTMVRIMRLAGYDVEAQYWVNDMGKQAMLLVWGHANIDHEELPEGNRDKMDHDLVRYYQAAYRRMEGSPDIEDEVNRMLKSYEEAVAEGDLDRIISAEGSGVVRVSGVREVIDMVLQGMKDSLSGMNVFMDSFIYESKVVVDGSLVGVIEGLKTSPLCREEDGAFYLDLSTLIGGGDDDRFKKRFVFTRSDGSALYTTRDLAYHLWKLSRCGRAVNILGEDHRYQSKMLELALNELGSEKTPDPIFYAFVSLPEGKMSTRRDRVVYLDDLLEEAVERARAEVEKRRDDYSEGELASISRSVGIGSLRFNVIKVQPEKRITFRWEDALSFEGSTAPFVQYSHARACSILRKIGVDAGGIDPDWGTLVEESEGILLKVISRFPSVIGDSARNMKPHYLANYMVETASAFNDFYRDCPVMNEPDEARRSARIALVEISRRVLMKGLDGLGIDAPDMM